MPYGMGAVSGSECLGSAAEMTKQLSNPAGDKGGLVRLTFSANLASPSCFDTALQVAGLRLHTHL